MSKVRIPANGWQPRPYQMGLWSYLENGGKRAIAVHHRRAGKDEVGLHYTATALIQKVGAYWHLLPQATQARKAIWDAVNPHTGRRRIDEAFPLEIREVTRENEMFIRFKNGSTWQVVGSDKYDSLVGTSPRGIVFSEWALSRPHCWSLLRPILAENGGWALFISTPRGRNHLANMYEEGKDDPNWYCEVKPANDTGVFSPETLAQELKEYQRELGEKPGKSLYDQEYMCDFDAPVIGAIYAALMTETEKAGHVREVKWIPERPVYACFDIGRSDAAVCWVFQVIPGAVNFIDYHEATGQDVPYFAKWLKEKPYVYEKLYFPWDARLETFAAPKSVIKQFSDFGLKCEIVGQNDASDRINAGRVLLRRAFFDREKTKEGREALYAYHYDWDEDKHRLSTDPAHDWASHASDSFGYGAIAYKEINPLPFKSVVEELSKLPTLGDISRQHDNSFARQERRIA